MIPCKICKQVFARKYNLKLHEKTQHKNTVKKIKCPLWPRCKKVHKSDGYYSTISNLAVHFKKHHPSEKFEKRKLRWTNIETNDEHVSAIDNEDRNEIGSEYSVVVPPPMPSPEPFQSPNLSRSPQPLQSTQPRSECVLQSPQPLQYLTAPTIGSDTERESIIDCEDPLQPLQPLQPPRKGSIKLIPIDAALEKYYSSVTIKIFSYCSIT